MLRKLKKMKNTKQSETIVWTLKVECVYDSQQFSTKINKLLKIKFDTV